MSGEPAGWTPVIFGAVLILIAVVAWYAAKRWPLAGVVVQFAAAAMATRFAIGGGELFQFDASGALLFQVGAGALALFCLYGGVMQIVTWSRHRDSGGDGGVA